MKKSNSTKPTELKHYLKYTATEYKEAIVPQAVIKILVQSLTQFLTLSAFLFCQISLAQTSEKSNLTQVFAKAVASDSILLSANSELEVAQEKASGVHSRLIGTQLNLTSSMVFGDKNANYPDAGLAAIGSRTRTDQVGISLVQPLWNSANWVSYEQSKIQLEVAQTQYAIVQQELILRTVKSYFDTLLAKDLIDLNNIEQQATQEQYDSVKNSFEAGLVTLGELKEAEARVGLINSKAEEVRAGLESARSGLETLTGDAITDIAPLRPGVEFRAPLPNDINKWTDQAKEKNFRVQMQKGLFEVSSFDIKKVRTLFSPRLDMIANCSRTSITSSRLTDSMDSNNCSAGLYLNITFWDGGTSKFQQKELLAFRQKLKNDLKTAQNNAILETRRAFLEVNKSLVKLSALNKVVTASEAALEAIKSGYQVGIRTNLDVLNSLQQLAQSKVELTKEKYNIVYNQLRLKNAAGILTVKDIEEMNQLLN